VELQVTEVGVATEEFTPRCSVLSVGFALSSEESLIVQRTFGSDVEENEEVALVQSPSQKCVYEPFVQVHLSRNSIWMRLTEEAAAAFGDDSLLLSFSVSEPLFSKLKQSLGSAFSQRAIYACVETVAQPIHRADGFQRAAPASNRRSCQTLGVIVLLGHLKR
jgi:hypothetical protein